MMDEFYHFTDLNKDGAYALAEAIVKTAIRDWQSAMRILRKHPNSYAADGLRIKCETFFMSEYFYMLTGVDGNLLLDQLEEDFDNACKTDPPHA